MGQRKHNRIKNVLPIRCWGTDGMGKPFVELAHTLDVSHTGVRVGGFSALVAIGDVIHVQYRHRKAKFEVAWVGRPGSSRDAQVGIRCLEAAKDIFSLGLSDKESVDEFQELAVEQKRKGVDSRAHIRYNARGGVDLLTVATHEGSWAALADISLGGCYLSTLVPLNVGLELEMLVQVHDIRINAYGTVRTCHPSVGMGVEFVRFRTPDDKQALKALIDYLGHGGQSQSRTDTPAKPDTRAVAERLQVITKELYDIEQLMKSSTLNPEILYGFRESVSAVRNTGWALQRWMELQDRNENPFPVLSYLNTERIRLATRTCRALFEDMRTNEVKSNKRQLNDLLHAVEDLFTHLAGIDFSVIHETPDEPPEFAPAPVAGSAQSKAAAENKK
jgi:hypothetical protein